MLSPRLKLVPKISTKRIHVNFDFHLLDTAQDLVTTHKVFCSETCLSSVGSGWPLTGSAPGPIWAEEWLSHWNPVGGQRTRYRKGMMEQSTGFWTRGPPYQSTKLYLKKKVLRRSWFFAVPKARSMQFLLQKHPPHKKEQGLKNCFGWKQTVITKWLWGPTHLPHVLRKHQWLPRKNTDDLPDRYKMERRTEQFPGYFFAPGHLSPTVRHTETLPVNDKTAWTFHSPDI